MDQLDELRKQEDRIIADVEQALSHTSDLQKQLDELRQNAPPNLQADIERLSATASKIEGALGGGGVNDPGATAGEVDTAPLPDNPSAPAAGEESVLDPDSPADVTETAAGASES